MKRLQQTAAFVTAITLPAVALANVPMALVYGIERYVYIPIVLIVEWLVLRFFFDFTWRKAAAASVTVNAVSYVIGIFALPLLALIVYETPLIEAISRFITQGTLEEYLLVVLVAAVVDTAIELAVLKFGFKSFLNKQRVIAWSLANLATTFLLLLVVGIEMGQELVGIEKGKEVVSGTQIDRREVGCIKGIYAAEIRFIARLGEEATNNVLENDSFDSDWLNKMEIEAESFPSILNLVLSIRNERTSFGTSERYLEIAAISGKPIALGEYRENNVTFKKMEYGDVLAIYTLLLESQVGEDYQVGAALEADPTCLFLDSD